METKMETLRNSAMQVSSPPLLGGGNWKLFQNETTILLDRKEKRIDSAFQRFGRELPENMS